MAGGARDFQRSRHGPAYTRRLARAWKVVKCYALNWGWSLPACSGSARRANMFLVGLVQYLYKKKQSYDLARHCVLSMQNRFPWLRHRLGSAWDSLSSWAAERPQKSRVPMPAVVLHGVCVPLLCSARSAARIEFKEANGSCSASCYGFPMWAC